MAPTHRCGTVAIIGRPNVGKSTLLNRLLGEKIAIVSPKPETTRDRLLGILTIPGAQLLFLDTPGIYHGPANLLAKHQVHAARQAVAEADVVLLMTEAKAGFTDNDRQILRLLPKTKTPVVLAINKMDRIHKTAMLPHIAEAAKLFPFKEVFPVSAEKGTNVDELLKAVTSLLPEGPAHFPADQITDRPMREQAQEVIREKALLFTHDEIPHSVAVLVEEWRAGQKSARKSETIQVQDDAPPAEAAPEATYIRAVCYVERESQKGILIGKQGGILKRIGQAARKELEEQTGGPVYLDLWVKVALNWRKDPILLRRFGYVR
jgi:GTP-binding protein Era